MDSDRSRWLDVGDVAEVVKRRKFVVGEGPEAKVVIVRDNCVYALDNVCIHKQRELVKGVVLGDRIVCPGHQWAFNLATGFEAKMEQYQPTYPVRVTDEGRVEVDLANPSAPSARPAGSESRRWTPDRRVRPARPGERSGVGGR